MINSILKKEGMKPDRKASFFLAAKQKASAATYQTAIKKREMRLCTPQKCYLFQYSQTFVSYAKKLAVIFRFYLFLSIKHFNAYFCFRF